MPTSWTALAIVLLAVAPGFVLTTLWGRTRTWKGPASDFRTTLQSLALSAVVQALLVPLTIVWVVPARADPADHLAHLAVWASLSVLILPALLGVGFARLQDLVWPVSDLGKVRTGWRRRLDQVLKEPVPPTVWDKLFTTIGANGTTGEAPFVLVQFNDGSHVGGVFAEGSLALTSPEQQGLYLVNEWILDAEANFQEQIPATRGILIPSTADIRWVRILQSGSSATNLNDCGNEHGGS